MLTPHENEHGSKLLRFLVVSFTYDRREFPMMPSLCQQKPP